jgi:deoxyribodipyrimidine photolyase
MTKASSVIHWFRLDLRIHDNLALRNAINEVNLKKDIINLFFYCANRVIYYG